MAETNPTEPTFEINQIYVKDLSFEAPNSPRIFTREYKLKYDHDFEVVQQPLDATNGIFESQLKWTVTAKTEDGDIAYVTECHQAGIFTLKGYDEETLNEMVKKACPQVLFPYLRETIG
ncbi:MAG: protein-export chaperone SecB, partial [Arenicellales bacterium]|nr:protein-export chaperone SecB [Arenicellales bacterium]